MSGRLIARALLVTILIWIAGAMILLVFVAGECLPPDDTRCPTAAEEQRTMIAIVAAIIMTNVGAILLLFRPPRQT